MLLLRRLMGVVDRTALPALGISQPLVPLVDEFASRLFAELDYVAVGGSGVCRKSFSRGSALAASHAYRYACWLGYLRQMCVRTPTMRTDTHAYLQEGHNAERFQSLYGAMPRVRTPRIKVRSAIRTTVGILAAAGAHQLPERPLHLHLLLCSSHHQKARIRSPTACCTWAYPGCTWTCAGTC